MKTKYLILGAALLPLFAMANTLNNTNQPGQAGYNPSTQNLQQKMQIQQAQQQLKLQMDQQRQQQQIQNQIRTQQNQASQRILNNQPGQQNKAY